MTKLLDLVDEQPVKRADRPPWIYIERGQFTFRKDYRVVTLYGLVREVLREPTGCSELLLPVDNIAADAFANDANTKVVDVGKIEAGWMGLDIGPKTVDLFCETIKKANTVIWNGPVGVFEFDNFGAGTETLAEAIAASEAFSVAGGGDTLAAIDKYGVAERISYISTGGGAFLEFVEGKKLPAVEILEKRAELR